MFSRVFDSSRIIGQHDIGCILIAIQNEHYKIIIVRFLKTPQVKPVLDVKVTLSSVDYTNTPPPPQNESNYFKL